MTVNRHKYFRWTRRTAWLTFTYMVLVPSILGTAGYMTEVSGSDTQLQGRGKRCSMRDASLMENLGDCRLTWSLRANGKCAASGGVT